MAAGKRWRNGLSYKISLFDGKSSRTPTTADKSLKELGEMLSRFDVRGEKDGPLWSPAYYPTGTTRGLAGVQEISCFVLDFDSGTAWEDFIDEWKKWTFVIHTTFSHSPEHPKWRAIFPLAIPVASTTWSEVYDRLAAALAFGQSDSACRDASRIYFLPSHPTGVEPFSAKNKGQLLNPETDFLPPEPAKSEKNMRVGDDYNSRASWEEIMEPAGYQLIRGHKYCGKFDLWARPGKEPKLGEHGARTGDGTAGDRCVFWTSTGIPPEFVGHALTKFATYAVLRHSGDFKAATKDLAHRGFGSAQKPRAVAVAARLEEKSEKIEIADIGGANPLDLEQTLNEITSLMLKINDPPVFYLRNGLLARVVANSDAVHIGAYTVQSLIDALSPFVSWIRMNAKGKSNTFAPKNLLEILVQRFWKKDVFPEIKGVVNHPIFSAGKMKYDYGYDHDSSLFINSTVGQLPLKEGYLQEFLDEYISDFIFEDEASRSNFMALAILPYVRNLIDGSTPFHVVSAPEHGNGKSLLAELAIIPALGRVEGTTAFTKDDDVLKKRIDSALNDAAEFILFDNLHDSVNSSVLAQAITNGRWAFTPFFTQTSLSLEVNAIFVGTGKNIELHPELARRSILIRLTTNVVDPTQRTDFKHEDIRKQLRDNRETACGLLCGAIDYWISKGMKSSWMPPKGSFVDWSKIIGGILECNGIEDFRANEEKMRIQANASTELLHEFFIAWQSTFGSRGLTSKDLAAFANERGLLAEIAPKGDVNAVWLGRKLTSVEGHKFLIGDDQLEGEDHNGVFTLYLHRARARKVEYKIIPFSNNGEDGEDILVINAGEKLKEKNLYEEE